MKNTMLIALVAVGILLSGCYHAQITTGKTASTTTVERPWAHGFLFGLVPPSVTNVAAECTNGVARVETKLSFVNMLASMITFSLYTPMSVSVTCAASSAELPNDARFIDLAAEMEADEAILKAVEEAANLSHELNDVVYIKLD